MAHNVKTLSDLPGGHPEAHQGPTPRMYVMIGIILFFITLLEIASSFIQSGLGLPGWVQVVALLTLATIKGSFVVMFFMHLRFDSRWFTFLFVSGMILATLCIVSFMLLFAYKGGIVV